MPDFNFKKYLPHILIFTTITVCLFVWYLVFLKESSNKYLKVVFLDVGQGDSIYIEAPNGRQMLIDGGPSSIVLGKLSSVMPYGDRSIDVVVVTHADLDHIGGLPAVLDSFDVSLVIENGVASDTQIYQSFQNMIDKNKINKKIARRGMHIILDEEKNIYFDILFPDRDTSNLESNDGSIVGKLVYGESSFLLTGDSSIYEENLIEWNETTETLHSTILKLGHHGSHTANSILWLEKVNPDVAIISAGLNNRYGHPHQDILDRLKVLKIKYLSTFDEGNLIFETDGKIIL